MSGERASSQPQHAPSQVEHTASDLEQVPATTGTGFQQIRQLQRLIGNQKTQSLMRQALPLAKPRLQRAPGLPPVRGMLQRDDDVEAAIDTTTQGSAAAAYAHIAESDINLTDQQIQRAIWYNQSRYQGNSLAALRRYLELPPGTTFDAPMIRAIARYQMHYNLGSDGMIGRSTYEHIDLHQMLESTVNNTPGTDSDLIFSINTNIEPLRWDYTPMPSNPSRMMFRIARHFSVQVLMPQHANPSQFRYRQMIKGRFVAEKDGVTQSLESVFSRIPVTHALPASYTEDGNTEWTTGVFYGRRSDPGKPTDNASGAQNQYYGSDNSPDQARGHRYQSTDDPKAIVQNLAPGTTLRLNMEFLGQVVRIATGQVMQQNHWVVFDFTDAVPSTAAQSG